MTSQIKAQARSLGFDLAGICPAVTPPGFARLDAWLEAGYAGRMEYLGNRRELYASPNSVLDGAQSIVMLTMNYHIDVAPSETATCQGRVASYANGGVDYHDLIRERLNQLADFIQEKSPGASVRGVVDTAPLMEREFAVLAGLGWIGKNTLLLNRERGSWFFLAALLTDLRLSYDAPQATDHCGSCRACLDVCPTDAFPQPYVLDASKCISYLTIELKDSIPESLRPDMQDWVFGCDLCQEVCPWNSRSLPASEPDLQPADGFATIDLQELFTLDEDAFRSRFRHSPLWRPKRRGLLRNAAIALGNTGDPSVIPTLEQGMRDEDPIVQDACEWALAQLNRGQQTN